MHETTPNVFLIARPSVDLEGMRAYLSDVGGESWLDLRLQETGREPEAIDAGELLIEFGGRACYRSWEPGLNPNVTKIRTERGEYFANILRSGHGSVLEHANWSFALRNVSRLFTHELVRHRAGSAFSQESLRYVRLTDIGFRVPPALEPLRERVLSIVEQLEEFQIEGARELGVDSEGVPFHVKKELTSALRRLAPIGLSTDIIWTANARTLRHVIEMRTAESAEEELRLVFDKVAQIMRGEAPNLFQDFVRGDDGSWVARAPQGVAGVHARLRRRSADAHAPAFWLDRSALLHDPVGDPVFDRLARGHEVVALHVGVHALALLAGVLAEDLLQALAQRERLARVNLDVCRLPLKSGARLVDQDAPVGQDRALVGGAAGEDDRAHRHRDAAADRLHVRRDVLHRVVDRQARVDLSPWAVDVQRDVLVGVDRLQVKQLRDDEVGDLIVDLAAQEHDAVVEQPAVDVERALAARALLDDHGDEWHRASDTLR